MGRLTAVYVDFQSPSCRRVWQWLEVAGVRDGVDVRPFSLDTQRRQGRGPWDRTAPASGLELLALGEFARDAGRETHHEFVDAAFAALHEDADTASGLETWLALGTRTRLDLDAFTADTERWRAEVGLWHEEARDEFGVVDVPALVFDDRVALYLDLADEIGDAHEAARLLDALTALAAQPVTSVRRTGPPD